MQLPLIAPVALLLSHASAQSLGQALANHGSLSMIHDLLADLDLLRTFEAAENATFLAMTDEAIIGLANWGLNMSLIAPDIARGILKYHFLEGLYTSADPSLHAETQLVHSVLRPPVLTNVTNGPVVKLAAGDEDSPIHVESGLQKISHIVDADIHYDSGVVHAIDSNLVLPHNISETTNVGKMHEFWHLIEKSQTRELLEDLRDVTIFLPNDDAVRKGSPVLDSLKPEQLATVIANHAIPNQVLYHTALAREGNEFRALSGMTVRVRRDSQGQIFINDVKVLREDILIYGGVAHILDGVLFPLTGKILTWWHNPLKIGLTLLVDSGFPFLKSILLKYIALSRVYASDWRAVAQAILGAAAAAAVCILVTAKVLRWREARKDYFTATTRWEQGFRAGSPSRKSRGNAFVFQL